MKHCIFCLGPASRRLLASLAGLALYGAAGVCLAQDLRPLSLDGLLASALQNHPQIAAARADMAAAEGELAAVGRKAWPEIAVTLETDAGSANPSSASRLLRIEQILWDFGRLKASKGEFTARASLAQIQLDLRGQELSLQVVDAWRQLLVAQRKLDFSQDAETRLSALAQQMVHRVEAKAAPSIDLELVNARVLQARVDKATVQAQWDTALAQLELLSGERQLRQRIASMQAVPADAQLQRMVQTLDAADLDQVAAQHSVVRRAGLGHEVARQQLDAKVAERFPQIYLRFDQALVRNKAGDLGRPSWVVGLRYTPGAGFATHAQTQAQALRVQSALQDVDASRIELLRAMQSDRHEFTSAVQRLHGLRESVAGASRVLSSYQRQFQAGRKSWLDLLNAVRELSQTHYQLAEAEAALAGALGRLRVRCGHVDLLTQGKD